MGRTRTLILALLLHVELNETAWFKLRLNIPRVPDSY